MRTNLLRRVLPRSPLRAVGGVTVIGYLLVYVVTPAQSIEVSVAGGDLRGSFDTTISFGASFRVSGRDNRLIGWQNGGTAHSINGDDGDLNYDAGDIVSAPCKATHELLLRYKNLGLFCRGFYFYDAQIMDGGSSLSRLPTRRTRLSEEAKDELGRAFTLLDAYLAAEVSLGDMLLSVRGGNQVLSWGEGTVIQNGINTISPVDVSKLRLAGAELREGLTAVPLLRGDVSLSERFSIEAFYQLAWDHTEIEPEGTFFSTTDIASPGGRYLMLGFGAPGIPDDPPLIGGNPPAGTAIPREADHDARDDGQFGIALRWFEPRLNDTELGFYFTRLHSRLPLVSGRTGTMAGLAEEDYAGSARYFREFPEDIDTYGVSFNADVEALGMALQGEYAYRVGQPLQIDGVELVYAALSPLNPDVFGQCQLGPYGFSDTVDVVIPGYRRKDMMQAQMTATKVFGPRLVADQLILLGEAGATIIRGMEDVEDFRYESPGTNTSGAPFFTDAMIQPETQTDGFPDDISWGYRVILGAVFDNAIGQVSLRPQLAFAHDVGGTTPSPIGNFVQGRKVLTASLSASFLISWRAGLSYTNSFGAGEFNVTNDRDFVSLTASYSF